MPLAPITASLFETFWYWLAVTLTVAYLPMRFVSARRTSEIWERRLQRPSFAPRNRAVFGIVWSILYILQALAATRIRAYGAWIGGVNLSQLVVYLILQVVLALYTPLLFRFVSLWASTLAVFVALVLSIAEAVLVFPLDTFAGIVFVILSVWLVYALALSIGIWYNTNAQRTVRRSLRSQMV